MLTLLLGDFQPKIMRHVALLLLFALLCTPAALTQAATGTHSPLKIQDAVLSKHSATADIEVHYPVTGYPNVDRDIREWAEQQVQAFRLLSAEVQEDYNYELGTSYEITSPSADYLSCVFEIFTYTGGAHPQIDIITFTYAVANGNTVDIIDLYDVFEDLDQALALSATYCSQKLTVSLGDMADEEWIERGTAPDANNFSRFALTPTGIRFYFPQYQVAPWAAGLQVVDVPLSELAPAKPQGRLWAR